MPRPEKHIDVEPFRDLIEDALRAFGSDTEYAVAMARRGSEVLRKKESWRARLELRAAAAEAVAQCTAGPEFTCLSPDPCGLGRCLYVKPEHAELRDIDGSRHPKTRAPKGVRPQQSPHGREFDLEPSIRWLFEARLRAARRAC